MIGAVTNECKLETETNMRMQIYHRASTADHKGRSVDLSLVNIYIYIFIYVDGWHN